MATRSMMKQMLQIAGRLEEGQYKFKLADIVLREDVSVWNEKIPEAIRGKEKDKLTEDQVKLIMTVDLGKDGMFENGQPKPRFQNMTDFIFVETKTGKEFKVGFYGGPAFSKQMATFAQQITGVNQEDMVEKELAQIFKPENIYNGYVLINDKGYNKLDQKSIREISLPPLPPEGDSQTEAVGESGFTDTEKKLLDFLTNEGKGIAVMEIQHLATKIPDLGDMTTVMKAWNGIKQKVAQSSVDGKVDIVLKQ